MTAFSDYIRRIRVQQNISQSEAASSLHISQPTLSRLERGTMKPEDETVVMLAQMYDISPQQLFDLLDDTQNFSVTTEVKPKPRDIRISFPVEIHALIHLFLIYFSFTAGPFSVIFQFLLIVSAHMYPGRKRFRIAILLFSFVLFQCLFILYLDTYIRA